MRVYDLGLKLFKDNVVRMDAIKKLLLRIPLEMIQRERNGEVVDKSLLKSTTQVSTVSVHGVLLSTHAHSTTSWYSMRYLASTGAVAIREPLRSCGTLRAIRIADAHGPRQGRLRRRFRGAVPCALGGVLPAGTGLSQ